MGRIGAISRMLFIARIDFIDFIDSIEVITGHRSRKKPATCPLLS